MGPATPPAVPIYPIVDADSLGPSQLPVALASLVDAGAEWVQLRIKQATDAFRWQVLEACQRVIEGSSVRLWIDDRVDLAALVPCFGVHVGQQDLPPTAARRVLPETRYIGRSTHDLDQLRQAAADPAVDVVALGPIFPTRSKAQPDPEVGLRLLEQARGLTEKPLVAIGGIDGSTLPAVLGTGVDCVAVIGALGRVAKDVGVEFRRLLEVCKEVR